MILIYEFNTCTVNMTYLQYSLLHEIITQLFSFLFIFSHHSIFIHFRKKISKRTPLPLTSAHQNLEKEIIKLPGAF